MTLAGGIGQPLGDQLFQISRDIKDNKFLADAEEAKADFIVSEDRDLLDLSEHEGTRIIPTHELLRLLNKDFKAA